MKNFARLARFAWPYRVRFILSLGCAVMVALLSFTNLSAVYPLLQILFHSQNCQRWVADQIVDTETSIASFQERLTVLDASDKLIQNGAQGIAADVKRHIDQAERDSVSTAHQLRDFEVSLEDPQVDDRLPKLNRLQRRAAVSQAKLDEWMRVRTLLRDSDLAGLTHRRAALTRDMAKAMTMMQRYQRVQPWIDKYLPDEGFRTLLLLIGLVMAGVAIQGFFQFCQETLVADIMQLSLFDIRNLFYRRTMALDLASFTDQGSAELMARFTNDMDSLSQGLNTVLSKVVREPLRVIACLSGALWFNWRLTCLTLILVPVSAITTYRAGKIMKRAVRRSLESMSNIYKILQESFQGIKVVKAFTMERYERRRFFVETKALYRKSVKVAMIDALSDPVLEMLALSTVSIALLAGGYLVLRQTTALDLGLIKIQLASQPMAIEDLLTLYAMLAGVSDPIRKLANVHSKIQRAAAASDRICALMDRRPEVADKPAAVRLRKHRKLVEFDQVGFSYNSRDPVLRGLELTVHHGETIALVGPNGCGKSTLMSLLPRFWDVQSGAIRIDGHDVRDIQMRSLRTQIGMVTQETILFEDSLANNIAYGNRHATRDEIIAASKRAYAHQFISSLPQGYDTVIGERGMGLSGGQRQRIALARAMLRDPAILILDEATSAVDIQDEALIRKAIEEFCRGRTTFIISHSLGSVQFADRIVLMNSGRIEAVGTDAELRRTSALYRRLNEIHYQRESA
jgi:ABC-type multidrug transport system fused ATPase/permease subunit